MISFYELLKQSVYDEVDDENLAVVTIGDRGLVSMLFVNDNGDSTGQTYQRIKLKKDLQVYYHQNTDVIYMTGE